MLWGSLWLIFFRILIFSNLKLYNFILVSKSVSSFFKLFLSYLSPNSMIQVENEGMNLHQYQINKELKPTKGLIFVRGIFSGLIFCAAYIRTFEFSNVNIEKRISQWVRSYCSYRLCLLHALKPNSYVGFIPHWIKLR